MRQFEARFWRLPGKLFSSFFRFVFFVGSVRKQYCVWILKGGQVSWKLLQIERKTVSESSAASFFLSSLLQRS